MDFSQDSIFQLLTSIEQILKSYQQNNYQLEEIRKIFEVLQQLKISPQNIFQQLIPSKEKIFQLKYALYKQITKISSDPSLLNLQVENLQKINYNSDSFLNSQDAVEILRKISAIKGEAMFINQELTIQRLQWQLDQETICTLKQLSLRKLMKEYMKKCRSNSKLQFLIPVCIRLVVLQQSILLYLQKTLTFFCSLISQQCQSSMMEQDNTNTQTVKSISSLSASLEQFLERQNGNSSGEAQNIVNEVQQCRVYEPIIRSDFVFNRNNIQQSYVTINQQNRRRNCCLWF